MTWERALEADARLAAKNALLIRAALRQSFDAERAFIGYQNTSPDESLTLPQQRTRARAWAIMNVRPNLEPLREVLLRVWAQGYALGDTAAREALDDARAAKKADDLAGIDWSKWKPGDAAQAIILKPPRAFQNLLTAAGITLKGFSDTTLTDIGNSIGEAIELGLDAKRSAKLISNHVASPARALTIAITEQNRAISAATVNRYQEAGLTEMEWLVFQPCVICAKNANQKVRINAPFPSGDTRPPAHPNCRCALAPVIPGFDDPANTGGNVNQILPTPAQVATGEELTTVIPTTSILASKEDLFELPGSEQIGTRSTPEMRELQTYQRKLGYFADSGLISKEQITATEKYRLLDYGPMNRFLRNREEFFVDASKEQAQRIAQQVSNLSEVIDKAPSLTKEIITYRGLQGGTAEIIRNLGVGSIFKETGFVSTSLNSKIAIDFADNFARGGMVIKIINPEKTKGLMMAGFFSETAMGIESEWLLPAGSKFEVIANNGKVIVVRVIQ